MCARRCTSRRSCRGCSDIAVRLVALLALSTLPAGCGHHASSPADSDAPSSITVTSTAFADGAAIPVQYTCDGDEISPPLEWTDVPTDAAALALVVDDPDAPSGTFTHWVVL